MLNPHHYADEEVIILLVLWQGEIFDTPASSWRSAGRGDSQDGFCYQRNSFQLLWNSMWTEVLGQTPQEEGLAVGHI